ASAHQDFKPPAAEHVGGRRFFGDLYRVVQGQQGHRRPEANAVRALRRCSQHHKRISQNRECAAEVDFPKPGCIEAESIPKLNLCNKVAVPLALRKAAWTGQLVKETEAHLSSLRPLLVSGRTGQIARREWRRHAREMILARKSPTTFCFERCLRAVAAR